MQDIFKKNQERNRASLYPPKVVKIRVRDVQLITTTVIIYTVILFAMSVLI